MQCCVHMHVTSTSVGLCSPVEMHKHTRGLSVRMHALLLCAVRACVHEQCVCVGVQCVRCVCACVFMCVHVCMRALRGGLGGQLRL